jgi:hypothetical protein
MTIKDLRDLIIANAGNIIYGHELLEHIEDIDGFVSLLGGFYKPTTVLEGEPQFGNSYVDDYPDPIMAILNNWVTFRVYDRIKTVIYDGSWLSFYIYRSQDDD